MTLQRAADPGGEVTMAAAAERAGVPMVLSSNAGSTFADVAATGAHWWLQVYVAADRRDTVPLLEAAAAAGAKAVVLTADTPVLGTRYPLAGGPGIWEVADAGWIGANAATPHRPRSRRIVGRRWTSVPPTSGGWRRRPGCPSW